MTNWLIVNPDSGSYDAGAADAIRAACARAGEPVMRTIECPKEELPTPVELDQAGVRTLMIFTGDGTINAATGRVRGWGGALLVLPGGTMNLLSRRLHGDRTAEDILSSFLTGKAQRLRPAMARLAAGEALVGVIIGPTTAWNEVREGLRHVEIGTLVEAVPEALSQTFGGSQVRLAGASDSYPAIHVEPRQDRLIITGFTADGVTDILAHGFAWLGGDFRKGPHVDLGTARRVSVDSCDSKESAVGLLIDGEKCEGRTPIEIELSQANVDFLATGEAR